MYLSLKKPWHIFKKELESKDVNNITYSTKEEDVDISLYNEIKKDINFLHLPFPELNVHLEIT